jgi:hypothetical protein
MHNKELQIITVLMAQLELTSIVLDYEVLDAAYSTASPVITDSAQRAQVIIHLMPRFKPVEG